MVDFWAREAQRQQNQAAMGARDRATDEIAEAERAAKIERFERGDVSPETAARLQNAQREHAGAAQTLAPPADDLDANLAAADAALSRGEWDPSPMGLIGGMLGSSAEATAMAKQDWLANQPLHTSRANPMKRFTRGALQEQRGVAFQPEEFQVELPDLPPQIPGETQEEYAERAQNMADAYIELQRRQHEQEQQWAAGDAGMLSEDTRTIGRDPGAPGFEEAQRQSQERVDFATGQRLDEESAAAAELAAKTAEDTRAAAESIEYQQAKEEAGMRAYEAKQALRTDARKQLAAMPEINREKIARGLSTGTKVAAVLGAIAQGWRGDAVTAVNDAIDRGVNEAVDRYTRRTGEYQQVIDEADDEMRMLDYLTNSLGGNVRAAAGMLHEMRQEAALQELDARIAAARNPEEKAVLQQNRVALEQQWREQTRQADIADTRNPERLGITIDTPERRLNRKLNMQILEAAPKEQAALRMKGIDSAEKVADREGAANQKRIEAEGQVAAKRAEKDAEWEQTVKKQTAAMGAVETAIDDFLEKNPGNIHGRGWALTGDSDQRIETDSFLTALQQQVTQAFTGATATEEQAEAFKKLVQGDWTELSDDALRARLRSLQSIVANQREYMQRPLQSAESPITNVRELSTFKPR